MKRDDAIYVERIIEAIDQIFVFIGDADEDKFLRNRMMCDACLMQLVVIGENGGKVSQENKERFSEVQWQLMKAARNFFAHAYEFTDWNRVWDTINTILPSLKVKLENILDILEKERDAETN
ncbi:hypothetical protein GCM10023093_16220 [Nemorincola caseinilytica]|uniref:DUF86 domain-containing protein n=1 Tax=Nemorincola caseinilytica TaxID=2054315 RepID=A0ABP8NG78_9BACT